MGDAAGPESYNYPRFDDYIAGGGEEEDAAAFRAS